MYIKHAPRVKFSSKGYDQSITNRRLYINNPTIPRRTARTPLSPNDTTLAPPVNGAGLVEPAPAPVPVAAGVVELLGMTYGGVETAVVVSTTGAEYVVVLASGAE